MRRARTGRTARSATHAALFFFAVVGEGCEGSTQAPEEHVATWPPPASTPTAEAHAPKPTTTGDALLPIPTAVTKLHEGAATSPEREIQLGEVLCVITLHDAPLRRGGFFPVVLFASGDVSTWRQTPSGPEEKFSAKLTAEELPRAVALVDGIPPRRALARDHFGTSDMVMGVSTRVGGRVETLYFDLDHLPPELDRLAAMLKGRLEAVNRGN